jgi:hypothetical protein
MLQCAALKASDDIRLRSAEQRFKVSDGQRAQLFGVLGQHPVQLVQAAGAELRVGRPAGVVEGAARRGCRLAPRTCQPQVVRSLLVQNGT